MKLDPDLAAWLSLNPGNENFGDRRDRGQGYNHFAGVTADRIGGVERHERRIYPKLFVAEDGVKQLMELRLMVPGERLGVIWAATQPNCHLARLPAGLAFLCGSGLPPCVGLRLHLLDTRAHGVLLTI